MSLAFGVHTLSSALAATVTTGSLTTASTGSGLVLLVDWDSGGTFTSVSDSKGNTWVQVGTQQADSTNTVLTRRYYCANAVGGSSHTFTLTTSGASLCSIAVIEVTTTNGIGITLDQQIATQDGATPFASGSITTTVNNEILISLFTSQGSSGTYTPTAGNSFTLADAETNGSDFFPMVSGYRLVSSIGSYNASWTTTNAPSTSVVTTDSFYEVSAGRVTKNTRSSTLGTEIGMNWRGGD
jgi:hypothetical protein